MSLAPAWFDPAAATGILTPVMILYTLHDAIVKPMPGKAMAASLAESWSVSPDEGCRNEGCRKIEERPGSPGARRAQGGMGGPVEAPHVKGGSIMADEADPKGNPIGTELVYEDDSVRVWRIDLAPGQKAGWHTHHLDYTSIVIEGDVVERPNGDGSVDRIEVTPGTIMRWHQGTLRHALQNVGTKRFRNVIVEVKGRQTGA